MLLDIKGLSGGYKDIEIVSEVSFTLREGETLALLGRNGTGKTTLLRTIMGLADRSRGTISIDGVPLPPRSPASLARAGVTFIPDTRGVFPRLTVGENLRLARMNAYRPCMLDVFSYFPDLVRRSDQLAGTLSGGLQQQVAISRALMTGARLIIIDELTQGLQPSIVELLVEVLVSVSAQQGIALLLVDQNPQLAMSICRRVMVLDHGRLAISGNSSELSADNRLTDLLVV
ncbi:ABC transporter ATP-binding protein [Agrobacterium leguminum]|uniref:ABC transporter ATP-binding protein n=1 Tax=Rhizobiaceae TaxID=82115 RepID=UPI00148FF3CF|nr:MULTISPECIES: ABC transporter ATP-binding protein [Rhizobiaceae]MCZ7934828.1 ABC transporter ATP-binding protein [Agrobacterium leguminum]MCZ7976963.1 ABC transporter ATP-binding protein [Agrobacterium salinitolerans]NOV19221.1 ABC transporter ATP-binding protein [Ensifer canadensis]NSX94120.1 ABC transporter ATP-binding protein [Agrobacterium tumefaciens]NTA35464.1 ABC transporter ATP-binding protein [Agrobacterium salinitolerans]